MQPLSNQQRVVLIDVLRGWALLGVTLLNYTHFYYLNSKPDTVKDVLTTVLGHVMGYVFSSKSWTLLSMLFGYGFSVFLSKNRNEDTRPTFFFLKRMIWLFVFACINTLFFPGDILRDYALLGLLLLLFYRLEAKTVFTIGVVTMLAVPFISALVRNMHVSFLSETEKLMPLFYSASWLDVVHYNIVYSYYTEVISPPYAITVHVVMFLCMLIGMAAHKSNFLNRAQHEEGLIKRIFWIALAAAIVLYVSLLLASDSKIMNEYFRFGYWAVLSTMVTIASGISWLYFNGKLKKLFDYFSHVGRMTLTHYLTHCFLTAVLFSGAGLRIFNTMPFWFYLVVAGTLYVAQVIASKWWLTRYNYGPAEWLWRSLTYGTTIPNRKIS